MSATLTQFVRRLAILDKIGNSLAAGSFPVEPAAHAAGEKPDAAIGLGSAALTLAGVWRVPTLDSPRRWTGQKQRRNPLPVSALSGFTWGVRPGELRPSSGSAAPRAAKNS